MNRDELIRLEAVTPEMRKTCNRIAARMGGRFVWNPPPHSEPLQKEQNDE